MAEFQEVMKQKERMCECKRFRCNQCGLYSQNNKAGCNCDYFVVRNYEEAEEIIMKWAEEHHVKTNSDKFKEVFGIEIHKETSLTFCPFINFGCDNDYSCEECEKNKWWQQEYKEPKGE